MSTAVGALARRDHITGATRGQGTVGLDKEELESYNRRP
jgi:hypothetical protein